MTVTTYPNKTGVLGSSGVNSDAAIASAALGALQVYMPQHFQNLVADGNWTPALHAARDALIAAGGGTLYIPSGDYRVDGEAGADSVLNGFLVPSSAANKIKVVGAGKKTRLLAGSNNMIVFRYSGSYGGGSGLTISANGKTGVTGLALYPEHRTGTSTLAQQSWNWFQEFDVEGCDEALALQCGPTVGGTASGCYYNTFLGFRFRDNKRNIWLRSGPGVTPSINNRNTFAFGQIGGTCNTGIQIDAGDTNSFYSVHPEGVESGSSPNTTPTAIKVAASDPVSGYDNLGNKFFGCNLEANTRDVENLAPSTEFHGCLIDGSKCLFTAMPRLILGGADPSVTPQIFPGILYQTNSQVAGYHNGLNIDAFAGYAFGDKNGRRATYAFTTANTSNVASIAQRESWYWKLGNIVEWHCRFQFNASGTGAIKVECPVAPNVADHRNAATSVATRIPIVVTDNSGATKIGYLQFSNHTETLNGNPYIYLYAAPGDNFYTTGEYNNVSFCLRYNAE